MKNAFILFCCFICSACFAQTGDAMDVAYKKQRYYDVAIRRGDSLFALNCCYGMNYQSAINSYTFALTQKPDEQYPKDRICEAELYVPNNAISRYVTDTIGFLRKKSAIDIERGDSAFQRADYGRAEWYYSEWAIKYYADLSHKTQQYEYALSRIRFCDSTLKNNTFKDYTTRSADSLFNLKEYFAARIAYQELYGELESLSASPYLVNRKKLADDSTYLRQQFVLCDPYLDFDACRMALHNEMCDGYNTYCYAIAEAAAEKAVAMKNYTTAKEFYNWAGDDWDAAKMDELIKNSK